MRQSERVNDACNQPEAAGKAGKAVGAGPGVLPPGEADKQIPGR